MAGTWESLLSGGTQLAGYGHLMDQVGDQRTATRANLESMQNEIGGRTQFQPWGVRSALGNTDYADGNLSMGLSDQQGQYAQQQGQGAADMFSRAMQDPAQRETDVYNRIRDMQRPGEQRQYQSMNSGLFGSGRGGMSSAAYGGSPEQHAFGMAQGEARNQAGYQAMGQAQQEMQNYANMGNQMFQNQYVPWQQLQGQAGMGQNNAQLAMQGQNEGANLWAQLGLGGMTADTNYSNIEGNAFGNMVGGISSAAGGLGGAFDDYNTNNPTGGITGFLQQMFGIG
jgi:hypothetical protein